MSAAARAFAARGMAVAIVDGPGDALTRSAAAIEGRARIRSTSPTRRRCAMSPPRSAPVSVLMNNAGIGASGDALAADGIAYVPFFPLGGFSPLQSSRLDAVAARLGPR